MTDNVDNSFYAKLAQLQASLKGVQKSARNQFAKYNYANDEDITKAVMPIANELGLFITFSSKDGHTEYTDCGGTYYSVSHVTVTCTIYSDTGMSLCSEAHSFSTDKNGDKAAFKALTGGKKYALRLLLGLVTTDDPEDDSAGGERPSAPPRASTGKDIPF